MVDNSADAPVLGTADEVRRYVTSRQPDVGKAFAHFSQKPKEGAKWIEVSKFCIASPSWRHNIGTIPFLERLTVHALP